MAIDAVFTWVDGDDPTFRDAREGLAEFTPPEPLEKWRSQSEYTGVNEARENPTVSAAQTEGRFRNMDELRYALRAIEAYAPWIDKIFVLTNGQVPDWIDTTNPRLRMVSHAEVFADAGCLPTFNSNAIELQMHRIPGLSEEFVYFNDDFFLGRPVTPDDFRQPDGRYNLFVEQGRGLPLHMVDRSLTGHMWAYNHTLIQSRFGKKQGRLQFAHTPQMYSRSLLIEMQALWREECRLTAQHKFRTPFDVALRILYTAYVSEGGLAALTADKKTKDSGELAAQGALVELADEDYVFVKLGDDRTPYMDDIARVLHRAPRFFCVNDEIRSGDPDRDGALKDMFATFLETCFPQPSAFERVAPAQVRAPVVPLPAPLAARRIVLLYIQPDTAELQYRQSSESPWQPCDLSVLPAGAELRGAEGATVTALLRLRIETEEDSRHPERGFPPDRQRTWPLDLAAGQSAAVADLLTGWHHDLAVMQTLEAQAAPALDHPSGTAMAQFLWADRLIRAGRAADHAEAVALGLERALLGGVDGGWVCHRLVLLALQCGAPDLARQHAMAAVSCGPESGTALLDLAGRLAATGQKAEALAVAEGVAADPRHRAAVMELRHRLLGADAIGTDDLDALIADEAPDVAAIRLWSRIALLRKPGYGAAAQAVSALIARLGTSTDTDSAPKLAQAHLARFRLLSRSGARVQAALDLRAVLATDPDVDDLIAVAADEARSGNPAAETSLLEGLRMAFAWLPQVDLAWATMQVRRGQASAEVDAVLTRALDQHGMQDASDPTAQMQMIRALIALGRAPAVQDMVDHLARDRTRLPELLQMSRALRDEGWKAPALDLLGRLCVLWPQEAELQINWADQAIGLGGEAAPITAALDAAAQAGADPFWVGYHRLRLRHLSGRQDGLADLVARITQTEGQVEALLRLGRDWREGGNARLALALHDGLRQIRPGHGPAAMAWADLALGLGDTGSAVEDALDLALDRAQNGAGDVYWTRYHRLRLFLAQDRASVAELECSAIAALGGRTDPFRYLIDQADLLSPATRDGLMRALEGGGPLP
ncbi:MAG: stealth conserved region 3 domain-containing protein [Paracoccaceae bacterium]